MTWNVYSSMLGGYIAMGFKTREAAEKFIREYHCKVEKQMMRVSEGVKQ